MTVKRGRSACVVVCSASLVISCGGWVDLKPSESNAGAPAAGGGGASPTEGGGGSISGGGHDSPAEPFKILILSTSLGDFRHPSIANCQRMLAELGQTPDDQMPAGTKPGSQFTTVIATDDLADFTESGLKDYGALFWCSPIGTVFSDNPSVPKGVPAIAMAALQAYVEGGGAWCGVHSATDFEKTGGFPWYTNTLLGAYAQSWDADPATPGTVQVEADYADHPIMRKVPPTWSVPDEWFKMNRDVSAQPGFQIVSRLTRDNRPVVWIKDFGTNAGRMFYTIRGHLPAVYGEPEFQQLVLNGILWATHRLE